MAADTPLDLDEIEAETRAEWRKNPSSAAFDCLALVAELRQLRADRDALAAIVRAVAASKPKTKRGGYYVCLHCDELVPSAGPWFAHDHQVHCSWRLSREWATREESEKRGEDRHED